MTKQKSTKRALLMSALALLMCVSMLIGSTFAWFTDSVATGKNQIIAGNLDIKVEYTLDGENWSDLEGASDLFQKGLWEPGHKEVVVLRITNIGSLALKYNLDVNIANEVIGKTKDGADIQLSKYLKAGDYSLSPSMKDAFDYFVEFAFDPESEMYNKYDSLTDISIKKDAVLEAGQQGMTIVQIWMPEGVGNEANHNGVNVPSIDLGINVVATQYTHESDSFGDQYDANATYPVFVHTADELKNALANGGNVVIMEDITVDEMLEVSADTTIDMTEGASLTTSSAYMLYVHDGVKLAVVGGDFVNENATSADTAIIAAVDNSNVIILDGNFNGGSGANSVNAVVWTYAGNPTVNIKGGTFTTGKDSGGNAGTIVYAEAGTVSIAGGSFANEGAYYWGKNWMLNTKDNSGAQIIVTGGVFSFDLTTENYDGNKVADGYKVIESNGKWYVVENGVDAVVSSQEGLEEGLANGGNVVLADDVKTTEAVYVSGGTLDGNGNTLDASGAATSAWPNAYAVTLGNGGSIVKNLTVTNAGYAIGSTATTEDVYIDNVTTDYVTYAINGNGNGSNSVYVTNSTINGWCSYSNINLFSFENCKLAKGNSYDGYLVVYGDTTFTDCTFDGFTMGARYQDGAVVAAGKTVSFTNCSYVTDNGTVKVTADNFKSLFMAEGDETDFGYLEECNVVIDGVAVSWN